MRSSSERKMHDSLLRSQPAQLGILSQPLRDSAKARHKFFDFLTD
jgi:hypothetical protein